MVAVLQTNIQKLKNVEEGSNEVLYYASAFFPLQIFPDSITVGKNKIDIIYREFFWTMSTFTVLIEDIITVRITTGPIFASLHFEIKGYEQNPTPIEYLRKTDAIKLQEIITGLLKAKREDVDINKIKNTQTKRLSNIGHMQEDISTAL